MDKCGSSGIEIGRLDIPSASSWSVLLLSFLYLFFMAVVMR